ncbi:hypothetical protein [Phorcysia thermohydrogeniphila]|uniref:Uncharacterized protein n=1 Tax=Phorcysia thermohydrogeniphila TaxID=936138 RepID=A0A4V2PDI2_9BACT|nr:hypothetical protein [Phorcysia thermohydrogeniphila]TCK05236.1 hypothetical protein CLV27_0662 [Phorcysia thermohydrogeniphila]
MKLKKLFLGILFITALTCGYQPEDFLCQSVTTVQEVASSSLSTYRVVNEERKVENFKPFPEKDKPAVEIAGFILKIDNRFASSPPRASP